MEAKQEKRKIEMCIRMLQILSSGHMYRTAELAELLDTNPRNVIEYKKALCDAGYSITGYSGKYGGYRLDRTATVPSLKLEENEKKALIEGVSYLRSRGDFPYRTDFIFAASKILSSIDRLPPEIRIETVTPRTLSMSEEELAERYRVIEQCIQENRVLQIRFLTSYNVEKDRLIHPYKLFMMNNAWFVLALCEKPYRVMPFKLNRIVSYQPTARKFRVSKRLYNEHDYFDERGLKGGGDWAQYTGEPKNDWYRIKLELHGRPAMYVKEYVYGKNQTVTAINKNKTILECDMQYKYNVVQFVLGFGTDCKILEPQWLRDEVRSIAARMAGQE